MFHRYHMPETGNSLFWYSYDYGMVHMIMLSSEHDFTKGSDQITWLENDLKMVDRRKTPWVIIGAHRAMYNSMDFPGDVKDGLYMAAGFEDLLIKYKVDLALWAHVHTYERTCKMYNQTCVKEGDGQHGITHVTIGNAGRSLETAGYMKRDWSLVRIRDWGYGRIHVANASAMKFEMT